MTVLDPCLFRTPHGAVIRCSCCGRLEIAFLGERLCVSDADFRIIAQTVEHAWQEVRQTDGERNHWRLSAHPEAGPVSVEFSSDELAALYELLHGATAMLELDAMLQEVLHT